MDNEWKWQQEINELQLENAILRREINKQRIDAISRVAASEGRIFTQEQLDFIKENKLSYRRVYILTHRYDSVKDALMEVMEGIL